ncbi:hypothetical protein JOM56_007085 [Amanita muscaria]
MSYQFCASDPTWDQLMSKLPYLDAVVHEILRFHPPFEEIAKAVRCFMILNHVV